MKRLFLPLILIILGIAFVTDIVTSQPEVLQIRLSICIMAFGIFYTGFHTPSVMEKGIWLGADFLAWETIESVALPRGKRGRLFLIIRTRPMKSERKRKFRLRVPDAKEPALWEILHEYRIKIKRQ